MNVSGKGVLIIETFTSGSFQIGGEGGGEWRQTTMKIWVASIGHIPGVTNRDTYHCDKSCEDFSSV